MGMLVGFVLRFVMYWYAFHAKMKAVRLALWAFLALTLGFGLATLLGFFEPPVSSNLELNLMADILFFFIALYFKKRSLKAKEA